MAKISKEAKGWLKQAEKQVKKLADSLKYMGEVQYLCQIGKHKSYAKTGSLVMVRKGAVHFQKDENGEYVKYKGKFVNIYKFGGAIPDGSLYRKVRDYNVLYLFFGDRWVKFN